jgi:prefoldin subunit 5
VERLESKVKELEKVIDEKDGRIQALSKELKEVEQKKSQCLQEKVRYSIFINIFIYFVRIILE